VRVKGTRLGKLGRSLPQMVFELLLDVKIAKSDVVIAGFGFISTLIGFHTTLKS